MLVAGNAEMLVAENAETTVVVLGSKSEQEDQHSRKNQVRQYYVIYELKL